MASSRGESEGWSTKARRPSAEEPPAPKNLEPTGPLFDPLEGSFAPPAVPTGRPAPVPERTPPRAGGPPPSPQSLSITQSLQLQSQRRRSTRHRGEGLLHREGAAVPVRFDGLRERCVT